jgi:N-acetylneuraminic acid mutarotase
VWTGSELIVWGGFGPPFAVFDTGGKYNPETDSWSATNTTDAPTPRAQHTAVWTGSEMIVWGGQAPNSYFNTGGRYNPGADNWTARSTVNAPTGREEHMAVWTARK